MPILDTWVGDRVYDKAKAVIGFGGISVQDESIDVLDMLRAYMDKAAGESCGQCFPCRMGLKKIAKRLNDLCDGIASDDDLKFLEANAKMVMSGARCDIGQTSPQALADIIKKAPELLQARKVTKGDYTAIVTAPCMNACPAHVEIPSYIEKIRVGLFKEGLDCVMNKCVMPGTIGRVCERPCESVCKRGENGAPVAIRHLKRYLFDRSYKLSNYESAQKISQKQDKIAVVGAGPSGLSCAYFLALRGYTVTIFEKQEKSGGMAKYGIPDYRLPADVLQEEVDRVTALGVEIRYGVDVGKDISVTQLESQGYKAIYVATGAPNAPGMRCEGEDECQTGFVSGIHYLNQATKGNKIISGKRVLVVGGGNVAMDCVRTALRHGFEDVHIIYRRTEQEMPADKAEIHEAKEEGVIFNFLVAPEKIVHDGGKVAGLFCQRMQLGEPDASGRRSPVPIEGDTFTFECDVIIHAIGQKVDVGYVLDGLTLDEEKELGILDKWNNLYADEITGKVHAFDHVFGGGDCVTGPKSLIAALAAGERACQYIIDTLDGKGVEASVAHQVEKSMQRLLIVNKDEVAPPTDFTEVMPMHVLPVSERLSGFDEVEKSSSEQEARLEASRCLRCFRIVMVAG